MSANGMVNGSMLNSMVKYSQLLGGTPTPGGAMLDPQQLRVYG